ncbi:PAS domain-containing sensor histidine kinase [Variovorax sp. J22P240]|uniref:PAS domain-containing sensor histidine kinase n=1 Tax=Variovorax sp. J22P240 TaxID=3053514 RepID=UPI0025774448|nr:PAS domain-containing sensor histidine kinase [Variovorax sp. J22P240]MDM0002758.1 PAS domain-containing sensor histidine kinase [Variovorax sp. J22P240]
MSNQEDGQRPPVSPQEDEVARAPGDLTPQRAFELMGQQSPDIAFVLQDRQGAIIGWRAAAEGVFGYSEAEVLGRTIDFLFTDEDRALGLPELERSVALAADRSEDDRWHVRKDGTRIWVCGSLVALREHGRHVGFAKVMCDRTNLRAQLETLGNRLKHADDSLHKRDAFFSRLTHELRNALAPISDASRLIQRKSAHEEAAAPLAIVQRQVNLMVRMMNDLAEVVRSGVGKLQLRKQTFNLVDDLAAITAVVQPDALRKGQTLAVNLPREPILILADKERVHQIMFNLLHNAVKYTPKGGLIWLHCSVETKEAVIKVEDTGVGIAPSLLPEIFELFTQENPTQSEGGFGVGLSLVKDLVDAHQGFVQVRSDGKDRGSEFTVRLPLGL